MSYCHQLHPFPALDLLPLVVLILLLVGRGCLEEQRGISRGFSFRVVYLLMWLARFLVDFEAVASFLVDI